MANIENETRKYRSKDQKAYQENFSKALKEFLNDKNLNQAELAERLSQNAAKVSQWANEVTMWNLVIHEKFRAMYPEVNLAYFVFGEEAGGLYYQSDQIGNLAQEAQATYGKTSILKEENEMLHERVTSLENTLEEVQKQNNVLEDANRKLIDIMHAMSQKGK